MKCISTTLSTIAIGTTLSLWLTDVLPAHAAILTYDFNVNVTSGPAIGAYTGYFSYDDARPTPGYENTLLPYYDVTEFSFDFGGSLHTKSSLYYDGRQGPGALPLNIIGGQVALDSSGRLSLIPRGGTLEQFGFSTFNPSAIGQNWFTLSSNSFLYAQFPVSGDSTVIDGGEGLVSFVQRTGAAPEPSTTAGLMGSIGLGWWLKKRHRNAKQKTLQRYELGQ